MNARNTEKETPLIWATRGKHISTVKLLIKHGADVNAMDTNGASPLFLAARWGPFSIVEVLIKEGAQVTHVTHAPPSDPLCRSTKVCSP